LFLLLLFFLIISEFYALFANKYYCYTFFTIIALIVNNVSNFGSFKALNCLINRYFESIGV